LSAAGYQTGAFLGNPVLSADNGYARGFDRFATYGAGDPVALVNSAFLVWLREVDWSRPIFAWVHYIDPHGPYKPPARLLSLFADDAIARADTRTVPLAYEPLPGWPLDYTIGALPRYQRLGNLDRVAAYVARYDAEIRYMDEAFGMLVGELEQRGVLDAITARASTAKTTTGSSTVGSPMRRGSAPRCC
jgi:arylsulfatase